MRRRVIETWVLLLALLSLWPGVGSGWQSSGVLVLDISRSMQDNDPQNIRGDAEQTFIDLLSSVEGNSLGIIFFGAKARVMKPITAIQRETVKSLKDSLPPSIAGRNARRSAWRWRKAWSCKRDAAAPAISW